VISGDARAVGVCYVLGLISRVKARVLGVRLELFRRTRGGERQRVRDGFGVNEMGMVGVFFFFSSRRRHTRSYGDWSSDVCSSDLVTGLRATAPFSTRAWLIADRTSASRPSRSIRIRSRVAIPGAGSRYGAVRPRNRSEERRVGKEGRSGGVRVH